MAMERDKILSYRLSQDVVQSYLESVFRGYRDFQIHPSNNQFANTYALKTYIGKDAERYYKSDTDAFKRFRRITPNIIGFYGSFRQSDRYHLILEFADKGTLEEHFRKIPPPTTGKDIISFWERMFLLIEGLLRVHEGTIESDGSPEPLHGWHQDIKLANILVTSRGGTIKSQYEWQLRLADLGTSHFRKVIHAGDESEDQDSQGTLTYGAPECFREDRVLQSSKLSVKQTVDVWSLGAVFSEAAVWLVESYSSLKLYRRERREATKALPWNQTLDCFHNGETVLDVVPLWHKRLKRACRNEDLITKEVLDMVEDMLVDEASRPKTKTFWTKSQRILHNAKEDLKERRTGSHPATPTRLPPESPTSSQSTSPALSQYDAAPWNGGKFGDVARVLSPDPVSDPSTPNQIDFGGQGRDMALWTNTTGDRNRQRGNRNGTFQVSTNNSNFNPHIGIRAQTFDNRPAQHTRNATHSLSSLTNRGRFGQSSQTRATALRHNVNSMPPGTSQQFDYPYYDTSLPRHQTLDQSAGDLRQKSDSFTDHTHQHQEPYEPATNIPFRGGFEDEEDPYAPGLNGTNQWHPRPFPPQPSNDLSPDYDPHALYHRNQSMQPSQGSTTRAPLPYAESHMPVGDLPQDNHASRVDGQHGNAVPPPQPSRLSPPGTSFNPPETSGTTSSVTHRPRLRPPATLSVGTAIAWRAKKQGKVEELEGYHLFPRLNSRDHVFIVDDALSMSPYWDDVAAVLGIMAYIVKSADPDGLDMYFTMSEEKYSSKTWTGGNSSTKLVNNLKERRRKKFKGSSNIEYRLDSVLQPYITKLTNSYNLKFGSTPRPLSLYVLTDGVWEEECDPSSTIKKLVEKLIEFEYTKDSKQIGIQFIRFGNDEKGGKRLNDLDDNLGQQMDIVDTTESNGNIWKMLLGAIDKTFDNS